VLGVRHHILTWHASHMLAQRRMHGMVRTHTACMLCQRPEAESCRHSMLREQERHNHAAADQCANKARVMHTGKSLDKPNRHTQHRLYSTQRISQVSNTVEGLLTAHMTYSLPLARKPGTRTTRATQAPDPTCIARNLVRVCCWQPARR
jgi:hypothetical protein